MFSKTVDSISRSSHHKLNSSVDVVRGLTWSEARDLFYFARRRLQEEQLPQVAGGLTFTTTLALVPLLTIILAIFTTFPVFSNFRASLEAYFIQSMMPKAISNTVIGSLTTFANKATGLSAIGAVALLFTSVAMMGTVERVFNQIWKVKSTRPIGQRMTMYWALMTLAPLMLGLSISATSRLFVATSAMAPSAPVLLSLFSTLVSVALTGAMFTLLYMLVPNKFVDWRDAAWGGMVAAIAFEVAKRLFAMFARQFPSYAVIYGALAALPVVKYERWWYQPVPGGAFVDAMAILKVLYGSAQSTDSALVSSASIRAHTRFGYDEMTMLLERMHTEGWVGRVQADVTTRSKWGKRARESADNWVLLANVNKLRLADVYRLFVFGGTAVDAAKALDLDQESPMTLDTSALARQVELAVEGGLNQTLAEHFPTRTVATG